MVKKNKNAFIHSYIIGPSLKTYINSIIDKDCFRNRNISLSHLWVSEGARNTGAIKCKGPCDFMIRSYIMIAASCCLMARFSFHLSQWVFSADFSIIDFQLALHLFDDFRFYIMSVN